MPKPRNIPSNPLSHAARGATSRLQPKIAPRKSGDEGAWEELCQATVAKQIINLDDVARESLADGLDEVSFRHFAPLLQASQEYAGHTGFRFREGSFDGVEGLAAALAGDEKCSNALAQDASAGSRLAAKLHAMPAVKSFADRLASKEPELLEELDKAFRIIVAESARNMMIATVKGLGLFPPSPTPAGISEEDCCYEDASASLPVIAQRLYNDSLRRQRDECGSTRRLHRRAMTAAFLVDFAYHAGVTLPEIPETYQTLLQEFALRNADFASQIADVPSASENETVEEDFTPVKADSNMSQDGWLTRWHAALWAPAGAAAVTDAAAGNDPPTDSQKAPQPRRSRGDGCV